MKGRIIHKRRAGSEGNLNNRPAESLQEIYRYGFRTENFRLPQAGKRPYHR